MKKQSRTQMNSRLEVRLYPDEKAAIQNKARAATTTASELVRQSLLRVQTWTAKDRHTYKRRTLEIARIGSNLNQIARWCNIHKSTAEAVEVIAHLQVISQELEKLNND